MIPKTFKTSALILIICGCSQNGNDITPLPGENYFTLTNNGAWCWFSDPRAVHFAGQYKRTYSGWVDSTGNIVVGCYDHEQNRIETQIVHSKLEKDDHNNPSVFIDNNGIIFVFYSKHSTKEPIFMLKSKKPEDIATWEPVRRLALNDTTIFNDASNTYTYSNIYQLSEENNKLYLFWRGTDYKPNYSVSTDNGETWSMGKILILPERIYHNRRPYIKFASNNKNTIHFAFTDGHPRNEPTNSIYYARYKNGLILKANGEEITKWSNPLNPADADVVYNAATTGQKAWIWDIAENDSGNPVIVYARFPNDSTHVYDYAVWNNKEWLNYELCNSGGWFPQTPKGKTEPEPDYSGGIVLDHDNPAIVYLSREKDGIFEIEKWQTPNRGKDWTVTEITSQSRFDNVRPFVIRHHPKQNSSLKVLWMNVKGYTHYTNFFTSIHAANK